MSKKQNKDLVSNRKAYHDFEILETFEAGLALKGTEVKSLREHGGSLQEAYVKFFQGELWLIGATITAWKWGNIHNHEERRDRKLLMHKKELRRLKEFVKEKGYTIVPLSMYLNKGRIKIKIASCQGKTRIDKRHSIREKEEKRRMQQILNKKVSP